MTALLREALSNVEKRTVIVPRSVDDCKDRLPINCHGYFLRSFECHDNAISAANAMCTDIVHLLMLYHEGKTDGTLPNYLRLNQIRLEMMNSSCKSPDDLTFELSMTFPHARLATTFKHMPMWVAYVLDRTRLVKLLTSTSMNMTLYQGDVYASANVIDELQSLPGIQICRDSSGNANCRM